MRLGDGNRTFLRGNRPKGQRAKQNAERVCRRNKGVRQSVKARQQKRRSGKQKSDRAANRGRHGNTKGRPTQAKTGRDKQSVSARDISAAEYKKIELSVVKAEKELKALNGEIAKTQKMKVDQTAASFDRLTSSLGKV